MRLTNDITQTERKITQALKSPQDKDIKKTVKLALEKVHDVIAHSNNKLWTSYKKQEIKLQNLEADLRKLKHNN